MKGKTLVIIGLAWLAILVGLVFAPLPPTFLNYHDSISLDSPSGRIVARGVLFLEHSILLGWIPFLLIGVLRISRARFYEALLFAFVGYCGAAIFNFTSVPQDISFLLCPACANIDSLSDLTPFQRAFRDTVLMGTLNAILMEIVGFAICGTYRYISRRGLASRFIANPSLNSSNLITQSFCGRLVTRRL